MKALVKGDHVIKEPFPVWIQKNLDFVVGSDGWVVVENYVEPEEINGDGHVPVNEPPIETAEGAFIVNGKTVTKEELLRLLGD